MPQICNSFAFFNYIYLPPQSQEKFGHKKARNCLFYSYRLFQRSLRHIFRDHVPHCRHLKTELPARHAFDALALHHLELHPD